MPILIKNFISSIAIFGEWNTLIIVSEIFGKWNTLIIVSEILSETKCGLFGCCFLCLVQSLPLPSPGGHFLPACWICICGRWRYWYWGLVCHHFVHHCLNQKNSTEIKQKNFGGCLGSDQRHHDRVQCGQLIARGQCLGRGWRQLFVRGQRLD